jgi:hypothetical protein
MERATQFAKWLLQKPVSGDDLGVVRDDGVYRETDSGEYRDQANWLLAWIALRRADGAEFAQQYLAKVREEGSLYLAALYWRARFAANIGDHPNAEVLANILTDRAPTHYYALAVNDMLRQANPSCAVELSVPSVDVDVDDQERPQARPEDLVGALTLYEAGLVSEARRLLRLLPATSLSHSDRVVAAWLYRRCGDLHRAALIARRSVQRPSSEIQDPILLELAYPRPFGEIVHPIANMPSPRSLSTQSFVRRVRSIPRQFPPARRVG